MRPPVIIRPSQTAQPASLMVQKWHIRVDYHGLLKTDENVAGYQKRRQYVNSQKI